MQASLAILWSHSLQPEDTQPGPTLLSDQNSHISPVQRAKVPSIAQLCPPTVGSGWYRPPGPARRQAPTGNTSPTLCLGDRTSRTEQLAWPSLGRHRCLPLHFAGPAARRQLGRGMQSLYGEIPIVSWIWLICEAACRPTACAKGFKSPRTTREVRQEAEATPQSSALYKEIAGKGRCRPL